MGFLLDSANMCEGLTKDKQEYVIELCTALSKLKTKQTIWEITHLLGVLVSYGKGVQNSELHIREDQKTEP